MIPDRDKYLLAFFILIGAALRIDMIWFQKIWLEEAYTYAMATMPIGMIIDYSMSADCNTPVYYILAHLSALVFGFNAIGIRIPALIAGILLIPSMYFLGREFKDSLTGVFCSGIVSVLFPFVYYSQYARAYSLSFLVFSITLIWFIRCYRKFTVRDEHIFWILAGINVWVHLFAIIPIGFLALVLLAQKPRARMAYTLLPAAICLPIGQMFIGITKARTIAYGDFGLDPLMMILTTPGEFFGVLFVVIGLLVAAYLLLAKDSLKWRLFAVVITTIGTGIWLSQFTPAFPRYYMTVALILILMAGAAMVSITELIVGFMGSGGIYAWEREIFVAVVLIITTLLLLQAGDFLTYYTTQKYAEDVVIPQLF